ncbi:hypothetical protein ACOME3_008286 [Neoechinorhynchus agilis]
MHEFVQSGDFLIHICPAWKWSKASDSKSTCSYLPSDKQMLRTLNVPCSERVNDVQMNDEKEIDGFIAPFHVEKPSEVEEQLASAQEDLQAFDMDTYSSQKGDFEVLALDETDESIIRLTDVVDTRTYDLFITYDKYYRTPRFWFCGYDHQGRPLSMNQMKEDVSIQHIAKTVTFEYHPLMGGICMLSVHPCKHAEVMKKLIWTCIPRKDGIDQDNKAMKHLPMHMYMVIFLKFIQTVVPTIQCDFSKNVEFF